MSSPPTILCLTALKTLPSSVPLPLREKLHFDLLGKDHGNNTIILRINGKLDRLYLGSGLEKVVVVVVVEDMKGQRGGFKNLKIR